MAERSSRVTAEKSEHVQCWSTCTLKNRISSTHPKPGRHQGPKQVNEFGVLLSRCNCFGILTRSIVVKDQVFTNVGCPKPNDVPNIDVTLAGFRRTTT